jgi:hypothetical protein
MSKGLKLNSAFSKLDDIFINDTEDPIKDALLQEAQPDTSLVEPEKTEPTPTPKPKPSKAEVKKEKKNIEETLELTAEEKRTAVRNYILKQNYEEKNDTIFSGRITEISKRRLDAIAYTYGTSLGIFINNLVNDFWDKYGDVVQEDFNEKSKTL